MRGPDKKFYMVRRNDKKFGGSIVDIPADSLFATLRIHPTWEVVEEVDDGYRRITSVSIKEAPKAHQLECPIDGKLFNTERGLLIHKKVHLK